MKKTESISVKLDPGAYLPERAHDLDAGYDLRSPKTDLIPAHGSLVIDTGVHIAIPAGYCGELISKSGLNVRFGLLSTGLIDAGYTGAICVKLYNLSDSSYLVEAGDKISQLVLKPVFTPALALVSSLEETERGEGGFGSTGK